MLDWLNYHHLHYSQQYDLKVVGRIPQITERYYAISIERRLKHPAVVAICDAARNQLFGAT